MSKLRFHASLVLLIGAVAALYTLPARAAEDANATPVSEDQLIRVLESAADPAEKAMTCKRLVVYGTGQAVPALAALLPDKELSSWARLPLEAIPGPAADAALREALGKLEGRLLVGVINSIGVRRDGQAVDSLAPRLTDADLEVATAAAVALGRIGNAAATTVLEQALTSAPAAVRGAVAEGCVYCAEQLLAAGDGAAAASLYDKVRTTAEIPPTRILEATRGAIVARGADGLPLLVEQLESADRALFGIGLSTARELPGSDVTATLVAELQKVAPERQPLLLLALADRGDAAALPAVLEAAKSGPAATRIAALGVVPRLGDAACIGTLLEIAAADDAEVAQAAREALQALPGDNVDAELVTRLSQAEGKARLALIAAAEQRRIVAAVPALLTAIDDASADVRTAALAALGATVTTNDLPVLITRVVKTPYPNEAADAKQALLTACVRMPDREACANLLIGAMHQAPSTAQVAIIEVLGAMGGPQALGALAAAAKEGNTDLKETSSRLLGEWMTTDAGPVLLDVAKSVSEQKYKIRALRGYLRIAKQIELRPETRVEMCQKALPVCQRDEERTLVLQVLELNPIAPALPLAVSLLERPSLKDEAGRVAVVIAEKVIDADKAAVAQAMQQVVAAGGTPEVVDRAKALAEQAKR